MLVNVVIPSYNRKEKLARCIDSILKQTYKNINIHVMHDNNDYVSHQFIADRYGELVKQSVMFKRSYVIGCWNSFTANFSFKDAMMWCVDDVVLKPDCVEQAVKCMETHFPDTDGVVGINQVCPGHPEYTFKWYGQILLGAKFIERYKEVGYKICSPFFTHFFQDQELHQFATSLNKFINCETAVLEHYHPGFIRSELDHTHSLVRGGLMKQDKEIFDRRQKQGKVWGATFER